MNVHSAGTQPVEHRYQQNYAQNDKPSRAQPETPPPSTTSAAADLNLGNHVDQHA